MTNPRSAPNVEMIPIEQITVLNPRVRNKQIFQEIVANIGEIGLKRPISVAKRECRDSIRYELACGQGRLEAYKALGQNEIPALVVDADTEDCLIMSLVENCARVHHRPIDLLHDIQGLKQRGHKDTQIARKTGLSVDYVRNIIHLIENGEDRLLRSVESGQMPVSVAAKIADSDDAGVQNALQEAYEGNLLRGRRLANAKRLIEQRRTQGKGLRRNSLKRDTKNPLSPAALLRAYRQDADRKRLLVRKAEATRDRLTFVTEALRKLLQDDHFITLLRAEGLDTMPHPLAGRLQTEALVSP